MLNIFSIQDNTHACSAGGVYSLIRVVDGDTLVVADSKNQEIVVRLYGIDCPEGKQDFGTDASNLATGLLQNQILRLDLLYKDRYGRSVAIVWFQDDRTLQEKLLKFGAGWVSPRYCTRQICAVWEDIECTAKKLKIGLWGAHSPIPPWEWRKNSRKR